MCMGQNIKPAPGPADNNSRDTSMIVKRCDNNSRDTPLIVKGCDNNSRHSNDS